LDVTLGERVQVFNFNGELVVITFQSLRMYLDNAIFWNAHFRLNRSAGAIVDDHVGRKRSNQLVEHGLFNAQPQARRKRQRPCSEAVNA